MPHNGSNVLMMSVTGGAPPAANPQPQRNRRRSARVPQSPAAGIDLTIAWLQGSSETTLAESSRVMRQSVETCLRTTLTREFPELLPRLMRMRQGRAAA